MRHELAAQVGCYQIHRKWHKMEVVPHSCKETFYPMIQTEIAFAWSKEQAESCIFEKEDDTSKNGSYD